MRVKVAGEAIQLTVAFEEQDFVRDTEAKIATLFEDWRRRFPSKSVQELLAMMTYQYASYYLAMRRRQQDLVAALSQCEQKLDETILNSDGVIDPESE